MQTAINQSTAADREAIWPLPFAYDSHVADRTLTVHRTSSCFGERTFAAAVTRVWNSLLSNLRKAEWRSLNTYLFGQSDRAHCELFLTAPYKNILTYLDLLTYMCYIACGNFHYINRFSGEFSRLFHSGARRSGLEGCGDFWPANFFYPFLLIRHEFVSAELL